jgi:sensor histidine kinase regulating citrate/malate metabolism
VLTENKTLSVLLNAKKSLAKEKNIKFTSIIATQEINMQSKDICSLLGNILDNAIDAAERAGNKKYIQLLIKKTSEGCVINCENTFGLKPIMKKGRFITRKENNLIHGIGTENIKDIVAKYNGEISFEYDDEIFNVNVLLPI